MQDDGLELGLYQECGLVKCLATTTLLSCSNLHSIHSKWGKMVGEHDGNAVKADDRMFIRKIASKQSGARLGSLRLPGRNPIATPHYIANTSRGAVPHIAQDVFTDSTSIKGVYVAVEDCEKSWRSIRMRTNHNPSH